MNPIPYQSAAPFPWFPALLPTLPPSSAFWDSRNLNHRLRDLQDTLSLAQAMQKELEMMMMVKEGRGKSVEDEGSVAMFTKFLGDRRIDRELQESRSVEAVNALMSKLRAQLEPFRVISDESSPWEEKSAAIRLSDKMKKCKRNKMWRKRKRKQIAEMLAKERDMFEQVDKEADEWRAREIAKDIAKRKVEKMKKIAKLKAKEEKRKLQSELELVLMVEKLQELRSIRIEKLKKQGHFFPEEDDKFLEKVRAAVEEEERQVIAAADTDAAKDAIASAEESWKNTLNPSSDSKDTDSENHKHEHIESKDKIITKSESDNGSGKDNNDKDGQTYGGAYNHLTNLPIEFYHYYHGSNTDMGTLIEVRRTWDSYIRPRGSRMPGHWVQPPPPADEIWASYLVRP